jgi:hypothetical protein
MIVLTVVTMDRALFCSLKRRKRLLLQSPLHLHEITTRSLVEASNAALESAIFVLGPLIVTPIDSGTRPSSFVGSSRSMTLYSVCNWYQLGFGIARTRPETFLLSVDV